MPIEAERTRSASMGIVFVLRNSVAVAFLPRLLLGDFDLDAQ
jgi:hypothetical protein